MYDDLLPKGKKITIEEILKSTGIGKCKECKNLSKNDICTAIRKTVHPDQIGCLDFTGKRNQIK